MRGGNLGWGLSQGVVEKLAPVLRTWDEEKGLEILAGLPRPARSPPPNLPPQGGGVKAPKLLLPKTVNCGRPIPVSDSLSHRLHHALLAQRDGGHAAEQAARSNIQREGKRPQA
ncbi:hypothetical protein DAERI_140025 [Deinococcus aerius]|uniref:Uncharacterized protein n=1 Tax=Deinococcus aerius TaxID=200253 RepID=A0A2I9CYW1_9DEIO|nr:hypothetical protein DAERI_140025 [Deinococcus aerius]